MNAPIDMFATGRSTERPSSDGARSMVDSLIDIEERQQAERKVARLRDLYAAVSQTHQAIALISDRDALFQEICRIVVEYGRADMAWIGPIDRSGRRASPIAFFGHGSSIPQELIITADASKFEECSTVATAIRTHRPHTCNNFSVSPQTEAWLKTAVHSRFRANASFPIRHGGNTLAALNLYASEKDLFDESHINLLEKMTQDISFAVRNDEHKAQTEEMKNAPMESDQLTSAILTAALDCIISINHEGEIISFNEAAEQTFGHRSADVLGKKLVEIMVSPEWRERHQKGIERFLRTGESSILNRRIELDALHAEGFCFPIELAIVPIRIQGNPIFTAFIRDISKLKQSQAALQESAMRYHQLVELSPEAIFVHRQDKLVLVNQAAVRMLGARDANELIGKDIFDFIHPDYRAICRQRIRKLRCGMPPPPFLEQVWLSMNGAGIHTEVAATQLLYDGALAVQTVVRDITVRKHAEQLQLGQNRILNMVATGVELTQILEEIAVFVEARSERALCSILMLDRDGSTLSGAVSPSLPATYTCAINGWPVTQASGSCGTAIFRAKPVIVTDIATDPLWERNRDLALCHQLKACTSWPIFGKNRNMLGAIAIYFRAMTGPTAEDLHLLSICADLAGIAIESRISEEKIRYLAHYDGLTSLPNRFLFKEFLDLALRNAQRHRTKFAVLFLDLDKFKEINDSLGHAAGDHALKEVATRLRGGLRQTDKIARMGGDEFYVLIEDLHDGRYAAEVAQKLLEAASRPLFINHRECRLSVSIGIGIYPDDGDNGQALLKNADDAMYRAKKLGKNGYQFYSAGKRGETVQARAL
jgi:diguanylate cyclase (GGDEF)-like protein/PAS domain S-box-containing protein